MTRLLVTRVLPFSSSATNAGYSSRHSHQMVISSPPLNAAPSLLTVLVFVALPHRLDQPLPPGLANVLEPTDELGDLLGGGPAGRAWAAHQ